MSNENVARMISGMDSGDHFNLGTTESVNTFNDQVDNYLDKFEKHSKELERYAKNLSEDLNGLEVMPLYGYVLIEPFTQNPFQKLKVSESGFIMDNGGKAFEYKSEEDLYNNLILGNSIYERNPEYVKAEQGAEQ
jgi:hypothetical protein